MMLYPATSKLLSHVPNRYLMVNVIARRARQIAQDAQDRGIPMNEKTVTLAIGEIADGQIDAANVETSL